MRRLPEFQSFQLLLGGSHGLSSTLTRQYEPPKQRKDTLAWLNLQSRPALPWKTARARRRESESQRQSQIRHFAFRHLIRNIETFPAECAHTKKRTHSASARLGFFCAERFAVVAGLDLDLFWLARLEDWHLHIQNSVPQLTMDMIDIE